MPKRRKTRRTPTRSCLPETPPQTPGLNRSGEFRSPWVIERPFSFLINVLRAVSGYIQVRSSSTLISARLRRCIRYACLTFYLHIRMFMRCRCNCRSFSQTFCRILLYPHTVIATLKRYPQLRGSIVVSHALIFVVLASLLVEYGRIIRVCYGIIVGICKLVDFCYASPQGIHNLIEGAYRSKPLYYIFRALTGLFATVLRGVGYLIGRSRFANLINSLWNQSTA